eukprot:CAMPEP_0172916770 /NCGR_PEP_ID=MMETSP1075-20121228/197025_1 /TAXON_ID=2916 /ORGANISM="Ceratium fusus, Strain PA161109" /LENGTH=32 /DNA_ID= /DNA_START= /DNA_END= /DNA_ORIENTATION=
MAQLMNTRLALTICLSQMKTSDPVWQTEEPMA